jgi:hypothetical protein
VGLAGDVIKHDPLLLRDAAGARFRQLHIADAGDAERAVKLWLRQYDSQFVL